MHEHEHPSKVPNDNGASILHCQASDDEQDEGYKTPPKKCKVSWSLLTYVPFLTKRQFLHVFFWKFFVYLTLYYAIS